MLDFMRRKWCTVSFTSPEGRRFSLDVQATSTFDAAHLYITHAIQHKEAGLPDPKLSDVFEIVVDGKVHTVKGSALQRWIVNRRTDWKGPRGMLFRQRPTLEK
jgi:hypothetical protein